MRCYDLYRAVFVVGIRIFLGLELNSFACSHLRVVLQRQSVSVLAEKSGRQRVQDGGPAGRAGEGYVLHDYQCDRCWVVDERRLICEKVFFADL